MLYADDNILRDPEHLISFLCNKIAHYEKYSGYKTHFIYSNPRLLHILIIYIISFFYQKKNPTKIKNFFSKSDLAKKA